jgi:hypothetical protein
MLTRDVGEIAEEDPQVVCRGLCLVGIGGMLYVGCVLKKLHGLFHECLIAPEQPRCLGCRLGPVGIAGFAPKVNIDQI